MNFNLDIWKEKAGAQLRQCSDWLARRTTQDTPYLVYGTLCGLSLWPLVEAAQGGALLPVAVALGNVAAGVGGNLLAEQVQRWKDQADDVDQDEVTRWVVAHAEDAALREALDAVLEAVQAIPQAQAGLDTADRRWFDETLHKELVQLGNLRRFEATLIGDGAIAQDHSVAAGAGGVAVRGDVGGDVTTTFHRVETEGGAYIEGDVQAGTFVGRDMHVHGDMYNGPPPEDTKEALTIYRRVVAQACGRLPLRGVDVGAADATAGQRPMGLAHVYVDLDTTTSVAPEDAARGDVEGRGRKRESALPGERETRKLSALEAVVANRRLVLLGDPGGGKSTFVNYVAHRLALSALSDGKGGDMAEGSALPGWPEAERECLPIRVILRDFARWLPDPLPTRADPCHLWNFIEARLKAQKLGFVAGPLCDALEHGRALLLLDGLDEVPTPAQRVFVRDAVRAFVDRYHAGNRVLVTCRVLSYQPPADPGAPDLRLSGFPTFELAPFDADKVDGFINAWYDKLARTGVVRTQDASGLARGLREAVRRPDLWRLAPNPLLLTVMALVHTHKGRLPDARALLYEDTVDILLWRWEQLKAGGQEAAPRLRQLLLGAGRREMDLKRVLAQLAYQAHAQVDDGADDGEALADIGELKLHKALAALKDGDLNWASQVIETMKLRAGLLLERAPEVFTFPHRTFQEYLAGAHLASLPDFARQACCLAETGAAWREVILLAVGRLVYRLEDTARPLALVGELCPAAAPQDADGWRKAWLAGDALLETGVSYVSDSALGRDLLARVQARLADLVAEGRLSPRERAEAGDTLARLGDPRPGVGVDPETGLPDFVWCEVPAGPFLMGNEDYDSEKPPHTLTLPAFKIGQYPVTNSHYWPFVEAGGYGKRRYWTAEGWAEKEKRGWTAPGDSGAPFNLDNHPVVRVSWYEVVAYCCWLTEVWREAGRIGLDEVVRLPSEAEWEKAARGTDGRHYPWGDGADPSRANYDETGIGSTSAVGCFPGGASPYGCLDMAGNVWEWTSSLGKDYPYDAADGREDPGATVLRVLRGGSFGDLRYYIRCAYRYSYSYFRDLSVGVRLVVSSIPHPL